MIRSLPSQNVADPINSRDGSVVTLVPPTEAQIRERAYLLFTASGGEPGRTLRNWLEAERRFRREALRRFLIAQERQRRREMFRRAP